MVKEKSSLMHKFNMKKKWKLRISSTMNCHSSIYFWQVRSIYICQRYGLKAGSVSLTDHWQKGERAQNQSIMKNSFKEIFHFSQLKIRQICYTTQEHDWILHCLLLWGRWEVSLPMAEGWNWMFFKVPSNPVSSYFYAEAQQQTFLQMLP